MFIPYFLNHENFLKSVYRRLPYGEGGQSVNLNEDGEEIWWYIQAAFGEPVY